MIYRRIRCFFSRLPIWFVHKDELCFHAPYTQHNRFECVAFDRTSIIALMRWWNIMIRSAKFTQNLNNQADLFWLLSNKRNNNNNKRLSSNETKHAER